MTASAPFKWMASTMFCESYHSNKSFMNGRQLPIAHWKISPRSASLCNPHNSVNKKSIVLRCHSSITGFYRKSAFYVGSLLIINRMSNLHCVTSERMESTKPNECRHVLVVKDRFYMSTKMIYLGRASASNRVNLRTSRCVAVVSHHRDMSANTPQPRYSRVYVA